MKRKKQSPTARSAEAWRERLHYGLSPLGANRASRRQSHNFGQSKHYRVDSLTMIGYHTTQKLSPKKMQQLRHAYRSAR